LTKKPPQLYYFTSSAKIALTNFYSALFARGKKDPAPRNIGVRSPAALPQCEKQNEYARPRLNSTDAPPTYTDVRKIVYSLEELIADKGGKNNIFNLIILYNI
jgi:hypothetical protein